MNKFIITLKRKYSLSSPIMLAKPSDDPSVGTHSANEDRESSNSSEIGRGVGRKNNKKFQPKKNNPMSWDSKMSKTPDLRSQNAENPIKYRYPNLVDKKSGVVTPSLLLRFVNMFPTGIPYSLVRDYWFNNEYLGKIENMALCYNGSKSRIPASYIGNYTRGVLDCVAIYVQLSAIRLLDERRNNGEFDSDTKFKDSVGVLSTYFSPNSAKFRRELNLLKLAVEKFFLPPELLHLAEETYSPKFSKFAGIRTVELMSIVYPVHPSILCYTDNQSQFDVEKYTKEEKELVSLFIDEYFWDELKGYDFNRSIPRRSSDRVVNFISNLRTCLEVNIKNEDGEFFGLHSIMNTVLPEYRLTGKLKDTYNVVSISEGGRFARINNSQTDVCKPYFVQDDITTVYTSYSERKTMKELFGSINFGVSAIPKMEEVSTYTDDGSGGRSPQGSIYNLTFEQIHTYHSTRGNVADLKGTELLKVQFGYVHRKDPDDIEDGQYQFKEPVIQPGLMVKIPDRNGGTWLYSIESDYTNALKNVVNKKPEEYRWYNAIEQPKYSRLRIKKGTQLTGARLVNADGSKIEGVEVEPSIINDSEMVACYFDLNCVKRQIGELVKSVWRSPTLVERVIKFPNGPTDRFIEDINK